MVGNADVLTYILSKYVNMLIWTKVPGAGAGFDSSFSSQGLAECLKQSRHSIYVGGREGRREGERKERRGKAGQEKFIFREARTRTNGKSSRLESFALIS